MFYSTNQSYFRPISQSEVRKKEPIRKEDTERNNQWTFFFIFPHFFLILIIFFTFFFCFFFNYTCLASNNTKFCTIVVSSTGFSFPAILFSLSACYNLIIFYDLALSLVICPFPAILFS